MRGRGLVLAMTIEQVFDLMAVRLKSEDVGGSSLRINWTFTDIDERWILGLEHRALHHVKGRHDSGAAATLTMTRATLLAVMIQDTTFMDEIAAGRITIEGDATALLAIFGHLDTFDGAFAIVEP